MAQSALTVTPHNPTPPTNFGTGINNANVTPTTMYPYNVDPATGVPRASLATTQPPALAYANTVWNDPWHPGVPFAKQTGPTNAMSGVTDPTVPPYLDDGRLPEAGGGPGTNVMLFAAPAAGTAAEGAGTEVTQVGPSGVTVGTFVLIPGSAATYQPTGQTPAWASGDPGGPVRTFSDLGNYTLAPNRDHASSLSPATNPALASINPTTTTAGAGTVGITLTGTNFTPQSVAYVNGVAVPTVYVSATSLTATVPKKASASPTNPVTVVTGQAVVTASQNLAFT